MVGAGNILLSKTDPFCALKALSFQWKDLVNQSISQMIVKEHSDNVYQGLCECIGEADLVGRSGKASLNKSLWSWDLMDEQALTRQRRGREDCRRLQHKERLGGRGRWSKLERMRSGRAMLCKSSEAGLKVKLFSDLVQPALDMDQ